MNLITIGLNTIRRANPGRCTLLAALLASAGPLHAGGSGAAVNWVGGPGMVEPCSEVIHISAELSGRIETIAVTEGSKVRQGDVLATIAHAEYQAQVAGAQAQVQIADAELQRLIRGARPEELQEAKANVAETTAQMVFAKSELERQKQMFEKGGFSKSDLDRTLRDAAVASAQCDAAAQRCAILEAGARTEDRQRAEAALAAAKARLAEYQARVEQALIRAPIAGVVLRVNHRIGEYVNTLSPTPDPIVAMGDLTHKQLRIDVDESDVALVRLGQTGYATCKAFGTQRFAGTVTHVSLQLGGKRVFTDLPGERLDVKVLQVVMRLESAESLPIGLRMDGYMATPPPQGTERTASVP